MRALTSKEDPTGFLNLFRMAGADRFPFSGPIREKMAIAARIMAVEHESSPAHDQARHEYFALERQLGENGRFSENR